jgi:hypothetical protein
MYVPGDFSSCPILFGHSVYMSFIGIAIFPFPMVSTSSFLVSIWEFWICYHVVINYFGHVKIEFHHIKFVLVLVEFFL